MEKREVLLMAEMARLEERLSPTRREKRQHSQKLSQKKTAKGESSFTKVLQNNEEESEQQTNQSAQNGHTNPQFNSSEVKMKKQKLFLLNVIGEREEALEQRLTAKSRRGAEELGTRIDGLEEVLVKNISDQGAQHKTWANYEIEKLNGRIAIVAEDSKTAVDKIETVEKEIERMEATRLVEMEMVEERLRESKLAMEVELNRTKEMLVSNKMEASLVPLRSQVERALEEPPRLASCAYQGAWNTPGTVTYSTALLEHRSGEEDGGGQLNRTSGVFTTLTPGVFTFVISGWVWMENARLPREGDNACLHLWLNDQKVVGSHWHSYSSGKKGSTDVGSRTLMLQLEEGDEVSLRSSYISPGARFTDISLCVTLNYVLDEQP